MARKPFPWKKLTPAQIELMHRLASAGGGVPYSGLKYRDLVAFEELRKLGFADMRPKGRSKLEAVLTEKGKTLRDLGYHTNEIIFRITGPQIDLLRHLDDSAIDASVGQPLSDLPGMMLDVCRRMSLRGWVEWYDGWNGRPWAKLTPSGREVVEAMDIMNEAILQMEATRRRGSLH